MATASTSPTATGNEEPKISDIVKGTIRDLMIEFRPDFLDDAAFISRRSLPYSERSRIIRHTVPYFNKWVQDIDLFADNNPPLEERLDYSRDRSWRSLLRDLERHLQNFVKLYSELNSPAVSGDGSQTNRDGSQTIEAADRVAYDDFYGIEIGEMEIASTAWSVYRCVLKMRRHLQSGYSDRLDGLSGPGGRDDRNIFDSAALDGPRPEPRPAEVHPAGEGENSIA